MAKYRVLQTSFIDNRLVHEGEIIEYDGDAGHNLELIEPEKKAGSKKRNDDAPPAEGDLV